MQTAIEKEVVMRSVNSERLQKLRRELEKMSKDQIINVAIVSEAVNDILFDRLAKANNVKVEVYDFSSLNIKEILETTYSSCNSIS